MSTVLPREPRQGDLFLGKVSHLNARQTGFTVSAPEFPLFMPLNLVDDTRSSQPNELVGKWVECEVVEIVLEKRAVIVKPIIWFDLEEDTKESYDRVTEYWYPKKSGLGSIRDGGV